MSKIAPSICQVLFFTLFYACSDLHKNSQSYCIYSKSLIGSVIGSLIESFERVSKWKLSVDLNSGLTSDTLNIPTGLVIVISIASTKKHAIIQLGKS